MDRTTASLLGMMAFAAVALVGFIIYRWRQRDRVRRIRSWIANYLATRFGAPPNRLNINCSDDPLWPVLVGFDHPTTGFRHVLRFACAGSSSSWAVDPKTDELAPSTTRLG
jgi:hypothetical protein